jgi:hypothetical protein
MVIDVDERFYVKPEAGQLDTSIYRVFGEVEVAG